MRALLSRPYEGQRLDAQLLSVVIAHAHVKLCGTDHEPCGARHATRRCWQRHLHDGDRMPLCEDGTKARRAPTPQHFSVGVRTNRELMALLDELPDEQRGVALAVGQKVQRRIGREFRRYLVDVPDGLAPVDALACVGAAILAARRSVFVLADPPLLICDADRFARGRERDRVDQLRAASVRLERTEPPEPFRVLTIRDRQARPVQNDEHAIVLCTRLQRRATQRGREILRPHGLVFQQVVRGLALGTAAEDLGHGAGRMPRSAPRHPNEPRYPPRVPQFRSSERALRPVHRVMHAAGTATRRPRFGTPPGLVGS